MLREISRPTPPPSPRFLYRLYINLFEFWIYFSRSFSYYLRLTAG